MPPNYGDWSRVTFLPPASVHFYQRTRILVADGQPDRAFICRRESSGAYIWFEIVPVDAIATQAALDAKAAEVLATANAAAAVLAAQVLATANATAATLAAQVLADATAVNAAAAAIRRTLTLPKTGVNLNALGDTLITGLPSKYRVSGLFSYSGSVAIPNQARIALYTGAGATGTSIVNPVLVNLPLGEVNDYSVAAAPARTAFTGATLYLRCTQAFGSPATASFILIITNLAP